jgi:acetyl-CoA acyltransferase
MSVRVVGAGMTRFAKSDRSLKELAAEAVTAALADAGLTVADVEAAYVGNAVAGLVTGQEMIRGQVLLQPLGLTGIPVVNVENACASSSTAVYLGCQAIAAGAHDIVLCLGAEKLTHEDKSRGMAAIGTAIDLEARASLAHEAGTDLDDSSRSLFMDLYASWARAYMERTGATLDDLARVAAKNQDNGTRNPRAQYGSSVTVEEVLGAREIVAPLTLLMCSPISDGAAAVVLASERAARRLGLSGPRVAASALVSGGPHDEGDVLGTAAGRAATQAYAAAGLGPDDLDVVELHDATAPAELVLYEELALAAPGTGPELIRSGRVHHGGALPVNPSGGLLAKGHPIGATGVAQICELVWQLTGRAGDRQVEDARVGLAQNAGGWIAGDHAVGAVHILTASD